MTLQLQIILAVVAVSLFLLLPAAIKIVRQYERGVVFRLGRYVSNRGPGLNFIIPFIDRMAKVDMRIRTLDVPTQEMITSDTVTVRVNAVVYFRVMDAPTSIINVEDFVNATWQIAQTTLRSIIGSTDLDALLMQREEVNDRLQRIVDEETEPWGVKVSVVEVKDVELPEGMQRAMAQQAEAERARRAKVIHAQGEFEAAERLAEAAVVISQRPEALQLRYLQTLADIATDRSSVIVFPLPMETIGAALTQALTRLEGLGDGEAQQPAGDDS